MMDQIAQGSDNSISGSLSELEGIKFVVAVEERTFWEEASVS